MGNSMSGNSASYRNGVAAEVLDVIIVGAGLAGLQALKEGLHLGLKMKALEMDPTPGGKWSGHGIYDCVQIQQHFEDFFLPGLPWPKGTPTFVQRDDVCGATSRYIAENGLLPHIECRSKVVSCVFDDAARTWTTTTEAGAVWRSRYIAWAVGTLGPPTFPAQVKRALAAFGGDVVHSHAYHRPLPYEGKHVVVLGYGASSVEIAQDLARNGACASVSLVAPPKVQADGSRQGQDWCLSRALPGMGSRFCAQGQHGEGATLEERNDLVRSAMRARHPKYPECMPSALRPSDKLEGKPVYPGMDGRPLGGRVIVSEGFLDCVSDGSVKCYPGYLGGSDAEHVTVSYKGQADVTLRCDAVVVATGYEPPTHRIRAAMKPAPKDCESLYKGMWMADVPNAAVIGHVYGFIAQPPFAGMQAKFLARVVSGAESLPDESSMQAWIKAVEEKYEVTQRVSDNDYFAELRKAFLGEEVMKAFPVGPGPPQVAPPASLMAVAAAGGLAAAAVAAALAVTSKSKPSAQSIAKPAAVAGLAAAALSAALGAPKRLPRPRLTDDSIATCASEALVYLEEAHNSHDLSASQEIGVLCVGPGGQAVSAELAARLRSEERAKLRASVQPEASGKWHAADHSCELVLCNGALSDQPASSDRGREVVGEMLRVLKPGGHAVVRLREGTPSAWAWLALFDERERPSATQKHSRQWRMVHKTEPRPLALGLGRYRMYVYRAA